MDHDVAMRSKLPERYTLGELSPEEREEFEQHYFDCTHCAHSVRDATIFVDNLRAVFAEEARKPVPVPKPRWSLADWFRLPSLVPSAVAAGFAVLTLYQSAVVIPELRKSAEPQVVASAALRPAARGSDQVIDIAKDSRFFSVAIDVNARERYDRYECDLLDASGTRVSVVPATCCETATLTLLLPSDKFVTGTYSLVLHGVSGGQRSEIDRYRFAVNKP